MDTSVESATKTACITFDKGCPRMAVDVARLFTYLESNGWTLVEQVDDADLILAACCAVHQGAEDSGFVILSQIDKRRKAGSRLVVVGCLAAICEERLLDSFDVQTAPPIRADSLDGIIGATVKLEQVPEVQDRDVFIREAEYSAGLAAQSPARSRARKIVRATRLKALSQLVRNGSEADGTRVCSLRVAWGCASECTYCGIRYATGALRSKALPTILEELDAGLKEGFSLFEVIAGDVGCWGTDMGTTAVELFRGIFDRSGDFELIVDDFNPRYLVQNRAELIPLLAANTAHLRSIVLPVQSGSDRILTRMKREYAAFATTQALAELREAIPQVQLITHVLVGFPGETDADFAETCELLEAVRFDRVDAYPYAPRPHTAAADMDHQVPASVIDARCAQLCRQFTTVVADYL